MQKVDVPAVSEWPFVTREDLWRAYRPGVRFSESAFQRLRTQGLVTGGVRAARRAGGRAAGQQRLFSRLNLLAVDAHRSGHAEEAAYLCGRAAEIEADARMAESARLLADSEWHHLPPPSALAGRLAELVTEMCALTDRWHRPSHDRHSPVSAVVKGGVDGFAVLVSPDQSVRIMYSQAKLASINRARPGEQVYLYILDLGGPDEIVRPRPAVRLLHRPVQRRGLYGPAPVDATGAAASALRDMLAERQGRPRRQADLTGLRLADDN